MNVDIYISERNGKREIRIPVLPESIQCLSGDTIFCSYDIMNKGEVVVPTGVGLTKYSWASEFPGKFRQDKAILRGDWQDPSVYHNIIEDWKRKGTLLTLLVTGYPINADVYVEKYTGDATGAFGDIAYEISFAQKTKNVAVTSANKSTSTTTKRTAKKTTTYPIKKGDTLWGIAQRFLGSGAKWQEIYNLNKDIIEQTAKKYGKSNSNRGWWIYPGVSLKIPQ